MRLIVVLRDSRRHPLVEVGGPHPKVGEARNGMLLRGWKIRTSSNKKSGGGEGGRPLGDALNAISEDLKLIVEHKLLKGFYRFVFYFIKFLGEQRHLPETYSKSF